MWRWTCYSTKPPITCHAAHPFNTCYLNSQVRAAEACAVLNVACRMLRNIVADHTRSQKLDTSQTRYRRLLASNARWRSTETNAAQVTEWGSC